MIVGPIEHLLRRKLPGVAICSGCSLSGCHSNDALCYDYAWMSTFAEFELLNSLALRVFRKEGPSAEYQSAIAAYEQDKRNDVFQLKPLPEAAFVRARHLSRDTTARLGTRAADLLHVAIALELGADEFYTFDRQQAKLAKEMKLRVNATS